MQPAIRPEMIARLERQAMASGRSVEDEIDERLRIGFGADAMLTAIAIGTAVWRNWRMDDETLAEVSRVVQQWRADMIRHGSPRFDDREGD